MKFKILVAALVVLFAGGIIIYNDKQPSKATTASLSKPTISDPSELIGKPAPDFTLQDYKGGTFSLSQMKGKKVVLFFTEGIMCYPACWNQISALGTDDKFGGDDIVAVSIVPDGKDEWVEATKRMPDLAKSTILLDTDKSISNEYGMLLLSSSMHRGSKPGHTYVIIDASGIVRYTFDDRNMGIQNSLLADELAKI